MAVKKKPAYRVYVVEDIDAENSFWTLVGTAFAHDDMKGMNVLLKALPMDGRLVLRRFTETPPEKSPGPKPIKSQSKA
ncbi:MAG: hypothetical protein AAGD43_06635 [Pseudomonadota bacterium]